MIERNIYQFNQNEVIKIKMSSFKLFSEVRDVVELKESAVERMVNKKTSIFKLVFPVIDMAGIDVKWVGSK